MILKDTADLRSDKAIDLTLVQSNGRASRGSGEACLPIRRSSVTETARGRCGLGVVHSTTAYILIMMMIVDI